MKRYRETNVALGPSGIHQRYEQENEPFEGCCFITLSEASSLVASPFGWVWFRSLLRTEHHYLAPLLLVQQGSQLLSQQAIQVT